MSLYLCVDCGGSKTSAAIADENGRILGRALGGPSNFAYIGIDAFKQAVHDTVSDALRTCFTPASIDPVPLPPVEPYFAAAWFGISGVDSPSATASVTAVLSALLCIPPGPRLSVCNDGYLLAAPLRMHQDTKYAVGVVGGTGSVVTSFKEEEDKSLQQLGRTGGWGWILGDEGGGFHVGRETIRQIVGQADRNLLKPDSPEPPSILTPRILAQFEAEVPWDLLTWIHLPEPSPSTPIPPNTPPFLLWPREKRLSSLSPIVFSCAFEHEDSLALRVLKVTSSGLVDQITMFLIPTDGTSEYPQNAVKAEETVICFGGSLVGIEKYRNMILDELKERGHVFKHVEFVEDAAVMGAVGLAAALKNQITM
jgi:N-acetylglucosamine kinase-like BadF-type ATPase